MMFSACYKVILHIFAVTWIFSNQIAGGARSDRRCSNLLRSLLKNPPSNTKIAINIGLSKARYLCREGFKLVGQEVRTCKRGKWTENKEPKCLRPCGKPEDIPHSKVVGSSYNFNDQLRYRCMEGYMLKGPRLRTCGEDAKWSEPPRCQETLSCGQRVVNVRGRIVGGRISQRGMWPWQIGIYRLNKNVPQFSCGGALISRQWVLTAAHCFYNGLLFRGNANLYLIKAGDHNLSVNEASQQEIVPEKIFVHPRFKPWGSPFYDGDIALVKLSKEVALSTEFVRTVCLPSKDAGDLATPGTKGTVAGWGVTRSLRRFERPSLKDISKVLRHATFTIQSDQLCSNRSGIRYNSMTAFCAGEGKGTSDTCAGDSGGAFVREGSDSKWVTIGIVSWGNGCAQKDQYGYYTRVYPFLDWIGKTMGEKTKTEDITDEPKKSCSGRTGGQQGRRGIDLNEDCGLDLVFVFDASVSVNRYYFQTSLEFAKELLRVIGASKRAGGTQIAAVTEAKLEFNLGDSKVNTIDKAIKAINNIMYVGWVSSYIRALKIVKNKVAPNARNDSHQVMMFITDGLDLSGSVRREARILRDDKHFEVYAIGVGRKVNTRTLMSIASGNKYHNHVISVRRYKNLQEAVRKVVLTEAHELVSCQSPADIPHGRKIGTDYSHNRTVRYECDAEYTLEGEKRLTCDNGKWNYDPPKCRAPCSNPGSPSNGAMQGDNFRHNSSVSFACDRQFQRSGSERIKCNDGSWSGSVPVCIALCPDPGVPNQGIRVGDSFQDGKEVTFKCNRNHDLLGNEKIRCNGGVWSSAKPRCKGRCTFEGNPDNGRTRNGSLTSGQHLPHGSNVVYACDVSYTLKGSNVRHCDDGSWNASLPSCKASCNDPGLLARGKRIGNDFSHGQMVTYACTAQGYNLVGNPQLTCNDGKWDLARPECKAPSVCGGDLTIDSGEIKSPGFPSHYPNDINCEWKIIVANGSGIKLTFLEFEVEGSVNCKYDSLEVYNGSTRESANQVAKLCGNVLPGPIVSSSSQVFLRFHSDSSMAFKGFKLQFSKKAVRCGNPGKPANGERIVYKGFAYGGSVTFTCNKGYTLKGTRTIYCQEDTTWTAPVPQCQVNDCGATLTTLSGEITSPGYPGNYQSNKDCTWEIIVPPGNHLLFKFQELDLQEGKECSFDYVQVFSGTGQEAESLGRYCGQQVLDGLASKAHKMTVKFRSDKMLNLKGFRARFIAVCGAQLHASNNKRQFYSHPRYGDKTYTPNLHCQWNLTAPSDYIIRLRFKEFDVEHEKLCGYDKVDIRDGSNNTHRLCGLKSSDSSSENLEYVSIGNRISIQFRTDLTTNRKGFIAEYWRSRKTGK